MDLFSELRRVATARAVENYLGEVEDSSQDGALGPNLHCCFLQFQRFDFTRTGGVNIVGVSDGWYFVSAEEAVGHNLRDR